MAGGACTDDVPGLTTTSDTDEPDTTTTGDPMVTTIDPDTSGGMTMGMDTGETTRGETEGETDPPTTGETETTGDPTTTDGGPVCGNGMVEAGEQCDVEDLGGETCESQGFGGGALGCADDCTFDTARCTPAAACGNGMVEAGEQCDGADLGGASCQTQGFDGGTLGCADDCTYDTSECTEAPACGDGAVDPGEACDGADLGGETCQSQGFGGGGVLACLDDCSGFDTAGCMAGGGEDCCAAHMSTGCQDPECEAAICGADPFCCESQWDDICANAADANPACAGAGGTCPGGGGAVCGNGAVEAPEVCDGANLNGQTCVTQGFAGGGVLACAAGCGSFNTAGCMMGGGADCCAAHMGTGCQDAECQAAICGADPFCCNNQWDNICANAADASPACVGAGGTCPGGGGGGGVDCCAAHMGTGCQDAECQAAICGADPFCCDTQWDNICANAADVSPACVGAGGTCP